MDITEIARSIAMAGQVSGAVSQIAGAYSSASAIRSSAASQAAIAQANARIAEANAGASEAQARVALARGQRDAGLQRLRTRNLKGSQRAAMAANGIDLASDTAVDVLTSSDIMGEEDVRSIEQAALADAWGFQMQAMNQRAAGAGLTAQANSTRASAAGVSPLGAAYSSLLTGAGQVADSWYRVNRGR